MTTSAWPKWDADKIVADTFTLAVQLVVEGELGNFVGRRMMDREINKMSGHTIVCGWGRVGRAVAEDLVEAGQSVVVVDVDPVRVTDVPYPTVVGDATRRLQMQKSLP